METHLLIIDPQIDLCDLNGSLYVDGADNDMDNLSVFIDKNTDNIDHIHVTLDSHHEIDVSHPSFWVDDYDNNPDPFTVIQSDDLKSGKWKTKIPHLQKHIFEYLKMLEDNGRYDLTIWPPHCLIGSHGHQIYPPLFNSLLKWSKTNSKMINYTPKGSNPFSEHYSAIKADVPDRYDPGTQINMGLIEILKKADDILISGEASSHCVMNTVEDILDHLDDANKLVWLKDATSPFNYLNFDFSKMIDEFIEETKNNGMRVCTTNDYARC